MGEATQMLGGMWESFGRGWGASKPSEPDVTGHCRMIEDFQASPQQVYSLVEQCVARRKVPGLSSSRVSYSEGWIFSARREYLRLSRGKIRFEVCVAPFGTGFFVATRTIVFPDGFLSRLLARLGRRKTFYEMDTAAMYRHAVESAVSEAVAQIIKQKSVMPPAVLAPAAPEKALAQ